MARSTNSTKEKEIVEETKTKQPEVNLEELMGVIKSLQDEITSLKKDKENLENSRNQVIIKQNEDLTRIVKVTSLLGNSYNLSTERNGKGNKFLFKKFGETKNIKFTDMQKILEHYRKDFEIGRAVLSSKKDYDDLQIGYIYDNVLNTEQMKQLICLQDENSVDVILNMDEEMQENIINLIAYKIVKENYSYDYNKIKKLEDEGFDINRQIAVLEQEK